MWRWKIFSKYYYLTIIYDQVIESFNEDADVGAEGKSHDKTCFNKNKATCKTQNFYFFLAFLLITIELLIAVSIYCYFVKYREIQKHLLPFNFTNNKLKM